MTSQISSVRFSMLTAEQYKACGVEINKPFTNFEDDKDTPGDKRLGNISEKDDMCFTCGANHQDCPGHEGYIELIQAVYNCKYIKYLEDILKVVCWDCHQLLFVAPVSSGLNRLKKLNDIKENCKNVKRCGVCGSDVQKISLSKTDIAFLRGGIKVEPDNVYAMLCNISNDSLKDLGFNRNLPTLSAIQSEVFERNRIKLYPRSEHPFQFRPESLMYKILPVIPLPARPHILLGGQLKQNDLTNIYSAIIKSNNLLKERLFPGVSTEKKKGRTSQLDTVKIRSNLQLLVNKLLDNKKSTGAAAEKKERGITDMITGKKGAIQNNIAGKRKDYSARAVVDSSGAELEIDEFGIPEFIANILTRPFRILKWNIDHFNSILLKGNIVNVTRGNDTINVKQNLKINKKIHGRDVFMHQGHVGLKEGDIIERKLKDGDPNILNRQPSLRVESMLGGRVKVVSGDAIKVPLAITRSLNMDFDGDEANIHIPQSIRSTIEVMTIMNIKHHIISRQNNSPIMGIVQNSLISFYLMTNIFTKFEPKLDTYITPQFFGSGSLTNYQEFIDKDNFMNIIVESRYDFARLENFFQRARKYYPQYFIEKKYKTVNNKGKIENRVSLTLTKQLPTKLLASLAFPPNFNFSKKTETNEQYPVFIVENGIILPNSGPMCKKIIGNVRGSCIHSLWKSPYSPEIARMFLSELQFIGIAYITHRGFSVGFSDCLPIKPEIITNALNDASAKCTIILESSKSQEEKEMELNNELNSAMGAAPKLAKEGMNRGSGNAFVIMKKSGAKGSDVNNGQISGFVGQQNLDNKRLPKRLNGGKRCLPHFIEGDESPAARGFVANSFITGTEPSEFFFHNQGGRRGVIDTSIKTADTGYEQKKIGKKMEDCVQYYDGSIRDNFGNIIQWLYGDDGMNPKHTISIVHNGRELPFFIDVKSVAKNVEVPPGSTTRNLTNLEIKNILDDIDLSIKIKSKITQTSTNNIRNTLKVLLKDTSLYVEDDFERFKKIIVDSFYSSLSPNGEAVGLIATCSIGEPTTQMTLNTFHNAGNGAKDVTMGVPRLKELTNATKNLNHRGLTVYFTDETLGMLPFIKNNLEEKERDEFERTEYEYIYDLSQQFKEIYVSYFIKDIKFEYVGGDSEEQKSSCVPLFDYDQYTEDWWVTLSNDLDLSSKTFNARNGDWVLKLKFDLDKMYLSNITLKEIGETIEAKLDESDTIHVECVVSPLLIATINVYINFATTHSISNHLESQDDDNKRNFFEFGDINYFTTRDVVLPAIKDIKLRGIEGITNVYPKYDTVGKTWLINTDGSNLFDFLTIIAGVDRMKTISDDVHEIFEVLGIEPAREFLRREYRKVLCFDGTYINQRHIDLLVDTQTRKGMITPASRYGISTDTDPMTKILFEQPVDYLAEASAFCLTDPMRSMSSSVMMGTLPKVGTGCVDVISKDKLPVLQKKISLKN